MPLKNHLFLLLLFILTSIPLYSSSYINPSLPNADGSIPLTCSSVPYPFGTVGIALPGFEIGCPEELDPLLSPPFLSISNEPYIIQEISLQGYINIFAGPIYTRCLGANGIWMESKGSGWINLDETPFALSYQYNILTVVGCNNLVSIRRQEEIQTAIRGCATFCGTDDTSLGDSCSGLGCCQAALPGTLKSFDLEVTRFSISNLTANFINCSAAFFAQRDDLKQNQSGFLFHDFNFSDPQSYDDYIIQLDWAIGNKSCEASIRSDIGSFACKKNSHCYNSPSMVGYLCNCSQGYEGNPYAQEGCTDIDECQYTDVNPCIRYCINTEGSFTCGCPSGMTGDGRKDGSGCKKPFPLGFVLGLSICIVILLLSSSLVYWAYQRRRQITTIKEKYFRQYGGHLLLEKMKSEQGFSFRIFKEQELKEATDHFNSKNVVGEGGNGTVYRGTINNKEVAIKKCKAINERQKKEFCKEILILSQINHKNIVRILGCCLELEIPVLVYEFISKGTLFDLLHGENATCIPLNNRLRIAQETAEALAYLHSWASPSIVHRDVKTSNILLDENFVAKVSDFGASVLAPTGDDEEFVTHVQGTRGYLDPEYVQTGQLTIKSDVYSFGVVLIELLTRKKAFYMEGLEYCSLAAEYLYAMKDNRAEEILDDHITSFMSMDGENMGLIKRVMELARTCLLMEGERRPDMRQVAAMLHTAIKDMEGPTQEIAECSITSELEMPDFSELEMPDFST